MEMVGFKSENFSKLLIHEGMRKAFMIIYKLKISSGRIQGMDYQILVLKIKQIPTLDGIKYMHSQAEALEAITDDIWILARG